MDPNKTLKLMMDAWFDDDYEAAEQHSWDLYRWLENGGFEPTLNRDDIIDLIHISFLFFSDLDKK